MCKRTRYESTQTAEDCMCMEHGTKHENMFDSLLLLLLYSQAGARLQEICSYLKGEV